MGVDGFNAVRWVRSGSPWVSLGSSQVVGFGLGVAGFIACRWIRKGILWGPLASSGVIGFTRARPGCRWFYSVSFVSFACALVFVGSIRGRRVHSHAPWGSLDSSGVV